MEQKLNRYLRKEYWDSLFEEKGFDQHIGRNVDWKFVNIFEDRDWDSWLWWQKGDFLVGYNVDAFLDRRTPILMFSYRPCDDHVTVGHGFNFKQAFEILQLIDSISDPSLMPLAINIKWAEKLVSKCLKELSVS